VWINEFHYDDKGNDNNEGVELAGTAGADLSGWSIVLYNGADGAPYDTINTSGVLTNQAGGFGALWFARSGIQNGDPDGMALVDPDGNVVEFLSYEGTFNASAGPAAGLTSTDIGVAESSGTGGNQSLQREGSGSSGSDFTWSSPSRHSRGQPNSKQTLGA
jgi:hypothetical protein